MLAAGTDAPLLRAPKTPSTLAFATATPLAGTEANDPKPSLATETAAGATGGATTVVAVVAEEGKLPNKVSFDDSGADGAVEKDPKPSSNRVDEVGAAENEPKLSSAILVAGAAERPPKTLSEAAFAPAGAVVLATEGAAENPPNPSSAEEKLPKPSSAKGFAAAEDVSEERDENAEYLSDELVAGGTADEGAGELPPKVLEEPVGEAMSPRDFENELAAGGAASNEPKASCFEGTELAKVEGTAAAAIDDDVWG